MKKYIRLGIAGSGFAAKTLLYASKLALDFKITDIFGGTDSTKIAEVFNLKIHESYISLLNSDIEAIIIATPHNTHFEYTCLALNSNKHVFCEKPFVLNISEGKELINKANSKKLILTVNHFQRLRHPNLAAYKAIKDGLIGNIISIHDELIETPLSKGWQLDKSNLGFLIGYGIHSIDRILWLLDLKVKEVRAKCIKDIHDVERTTDLLLFFEKEIYATMISTDQKGCIDKTMVGKAEFKSRIVGENGIIELDAYGKCIFYNSTTFKQLSELKIWSSFESPDRLEAYYLMLKNFVDVINQKEIKLIINASEALYNVEICLAAYKSNNLNMPICL